MDERMKTHGDFGWCDLMTDEPEKARAFYTDVIGWTTEVVDIGKGPYTVLKTGERPVAGIMSKPPEASGAPTVAPVDIPSVGRMAVTYAEPGD